MKYPPLPDCASLNYLASEFTLWTSPFTRETVTIRRKVQRNGSFLWSVYNGEKTVWNRSKSQFDWEGFSSGRGKNYYKTCRFNTLSEAWYQAHRAITMLQKFEAEEIKVRAELREKFAQESA